MIKKFTFNKSSIKFRRRELRRVSTEAERRLWSRLRNKQLAGLKFFRQYSVGPYITDFYCPAVRLSVEADGSQHGDARKNYDERRKEYLVRFNIIELRFWDNDILQNTDGVILKILEHITPPAPP